MTPSGKFGKAPSPLGGEGWGEGMLTYRVFFLLTRMLRIRPLPGVER